MEITTVFFSIGAIGLLALGIVACLDYDFFGSKNKITEEKKKELEN